MAQPLVSLCMIVRNEEQNISDILKAVREKVGEIVIVDTGSTDRTREIAREMGAAVFEMTWQDDFAAARNEALRHARGKWIFWLDADDRLDETNMNRLAGLFERLKNYDVANLPVFLITCQSRCALSHTTVTIHQGRLFPNDPRLAWKGRVHERLCHCGRDEHERLIKTDVVIDHIGYSDSAVASRKQHRDLRILEQLYVINPDDPVTLFYLARSRMWQGHQAAALRMLHRAIELDPAGKLATTASAYILAGNLLGETGQHADALALNARGLKLFPKEADLLYQRGHELLETDRLTEAEAAVRAVLNADVAGLSFRGTSTSGHAEKFWVLLGCIHHRQGRLLESAGVFRAVLGRDPQCSEALYYLAQIDLSMGLRAELNECLSRLNSCEEMLFETSLLRAMVYDADRDFASAVLWAKAALTANPNSGGAHGVLCDALMHQGADIATCIQAHERAVRAPDAPPHLLGRLNKLRAAVEGNKVTDKKATSAPGAIGFGAGNFVVRAS